MGNAFFAIQYTQCKGKSIFAQTFWTVFYGCDFIEVSEFRAGNVSANRNILRNFDVKTAAMADKIGCINIIFTDYCSIILNKACKRTFENCGIADW